MLKKLKKLEDKVEPYFSLTALAISFLFLEYIIFVIFINIKVFSNNTLNKTTLIIFYIGIGSFFVFLYYKFFLFIVVKKTLQEKELKKLLKEKRLWENKIKKKENKTPIASVKRLRSLLNDVKKIVWIVANLDKLSHCILEWLNDRTNGNVEFIVLKLSTYEMSSEKIATKLERLEKLPVPIDYEELI